MKSPQRPGDDDPSPLARRLAGWQPTSPTASRDRILFEAGVAVGRRQVQGRLVAAMILGLAGSGGWVWHERAERDRLTRVLAARPSTPRSATADPHPTPPSPDPAVVLEPTSYLALSHRFEANGIDHLDPIQARTEPPTSGPRASARSVLDSFSTRRPHDITEL